MKEVGYVQVLMYTAQLGLETTFFSPFQKWALQFK